MVRWLGDREGAWGGPGTAAIDDRRLILAGDHRRHASLRTIERVRRSRRHVWVERTHAHDWLVRCATEADADRLAALLQEAVEAVRPS